MDDHSLKTATRKPPIPLNRLLWGSYLRMSLIPLLIIELGFLATYWISETLVYQRNMETVSTVSRNYFLDIAHREAATISASLEAVASQTRVFARQTRHALESGYAPPAAERARYIFPRSGGMRTAYDNGTTASFYAGGTNVGPREMDKVWRLSALDPFMMAVKDSNTSIASIYVNTHDSYNRIYPYVDAALQFSHEMVIPSYNFYYEADAENNPERRDVWTEAYVDPAGNGWMVSSIAPVWRGDKLEGVVGIDVTLKTIIDNLLTLELPWNGYAVLVDQSGTIIALPPAGEQDFGISELTDYDYSSVIMSDTAKPERFNLNLRDDTRQLASAMKLQPEGEVELDLGGMRLASFSTVPQTDWRLVIIAPTSMIYADARALHDRLRIVGYIMLAVLVIFYIAFFAFLTLRARRTSRLIAEPIEQVTTLIDRMYDRSLTPSFEGSEVLELDRLGHHLLTTRQLLCDAEDEARRQGRVALDALEHVRKVNAEMISFTRLMSHEIRTPLSIIDSNAQIIQRKADTLNPHDLKIRADRLRTTVATIADLLSKMLMRFDAIERSTGNETPFDAVDGPSATRLMTSPATAPQRLLPSLPMQNGFEAASFIEAVQRSLRPRASDAFPDFALSQARYGPLPFETSRQTGVYFNLTYDVPLGISLADLHEMADKLGDAALVSLSCTQTTMTLIASFQQK